jgi:H+-translocating NAD(P) transhydrogenase subunit beta
MDIKFLTDIGFLLGSIGFVWGLKLLSSPDSARRGNAIASVGMVLAIISIIFMPMDKGDNNYAWVFGGLAVGAVVGYTMAMKVKMTAMPQMVSIFNGFGGACAVLIAMVELRHFYGGTTAMTSGQIGISLAALLIGGIAFTGSMLAWFKLEEWIRDNAFVLPKHAIFNIVLLVIILLVGGYTYIQNSEAGMLLAVIFMCLALLYGASFVVPIGGADMPVVISLLNSFSGLSAASAGLIYGNNFMLVGGILVGASGTILTVLMCDAMNRSLLNVLIGGFGGGGTSSAKAGAGGLVAKEVSLNDAAIQLYYSSSVMVVPGYGLAVAQAQKVCKEIDDLLDANGVSVKYAIHPVAGRMPGHMNVSAGRSRCALPQATRPRRRQ